jgi:hypothetical protein
MVDVSISASPKLLIEPQETETTLTLQLSESPPQGGLIVPFDVSIDSGAPNPLAQFNLQNFSFEGAELDTVNTDTLDEFALAVNSQTARVNLIVGNDQFNEGVDEVTFSIRPTSDFNIVPDAGETTFTIVDDETLIPEEPEPPEPPEPPEQPDSDRVSLAPETNPEIQLEQVEQPQEVETESRNQDQLVSVGLRENNLVFDTLTSFVVSNVPEGESVEVEISLPEGQPANNYFNFDPEESDWSEFLPPQGEPDAPGARFEDRNNDQTNDIVVLNLVDGGVGDLDGEVNGEIVNIGNSVSIPEGGQITPSPQSDEIFNIIAPPDERANIRHEVTGRDNSNQVFEIGYTLLNSDQSLPQTAQEKLAAVNNGATLFSVYPNTFENGEPGQFDFSNFGFKNANNPLDRTISLESGTRIAYYLIEGKDITSDTLNANNIGKVQFDFFEVSNNPSVQGVTFNAKTDTDEPLITFTATTDTDEPPIGTNLQAQTGREVFDLRGNTGSVTATLGFDVISQAGFDNLIGFYTVQDQAGNIDTGNDLIAPGEAGYTEAALANSRQNFGNDAILRGGKAQGDSFTVEGGQIIVPFILAQGGDLDEIPSELSEEVEAYFPYISANADGADHFRILADNTFGVEDLNGGGDQDFNDIIFQLDFA